MPLTPEELAARKQATLARHLADRAAQGFPPVIESPSFIQWAQGLVRAADERIAREEKSVRATSHPTSGAKGALSRRGLAPSSDPALTVERDTAPEATGAGHKTSA